MAFFKKLKEGIENQTECVYNEKDPVKDAKLKQIFFEVSKLAHMIPNMIDVLITFTINQKFDE